MREIVCPSGLAGIVRPLKMKESRHLTNRQLEEQGRLVETLVDSCWCETTDPGPYTLAKDNRVDWGRVLQGDRFHALIQVAIETYGKGYDFHLSCESCRRRIDWSADLEALDVYDLPEESIAKIKAGDNRFEATTRTGQRVWHRLLVGEDERQIARWHNEGIRDILERTFLRRLVEVEDVEKGALSDWVADLDFGESDHLREQFEEADCGIETEIQIACPRVSCASVQKVELPFGIDLLLRTGGGKRAKDRRKRRARKRSSR